MGDQLQNVFAAPQNQLASIPILRIHPDFLSHSFYFKVDGHGGTQTNVMVPLQISPEKTSGEVYDLFIQLADPTCAIGFVTVAPLAHYVTG